MIKVMEQVDKQSLLSSSSLYKCFQEIGVQCTKSKPYDCMVHKEPISIVYNNKNIFEYVHSAKKYDIGKTIISDEYALMTTRVKSTTLSITKDWCTQKHNIKSVYCCSKEVSKTVKQRKLLVIEMNNSTNQLLGIGFIYNITPEPFKHRIFIGENESNNKFTYICRVRVDIDEMTESELSLLRLIGTFCFKGKSNLKRTRGITRFPIRILSKLNNEEQKNILLDVKKIFTDRFSKA